MTEIVESSRHTFVNTGEYYDFDDDTKFNDSEAFAIDLVNYIEGKQKTIESVGTISFIAIQTEKNGKVTNVFYGHNAGNPLIEENDKTLFCLRSLGVGGGLKTLPIDILYRLDWNTQEITEEKVVIGNQFSRSGYAQPADVPKRSNDDVDYNAGIRNGFGYDATRDAVTSDPSNLFRVLNPEHPLLADGSMESPLTIDDVMGTKQSKLPVIRYDDEIDTFVDRVNPNESDDVERSKELRKQLHDARIADEAAWDELEMAKSLVTTAHNGKHNIEERDVALAMLEAAQNAYRETHNDVLCLEIELAA